MVDKQDGPKLIAVEITEIIGTKRLPTAPRKAKNTCLQCDACGKDIEDEYFTAGFRKAKRHLMFHESCLPVPPDMKA